MQLSGERLAPWGHCSSAVCLLQHGHWAATVHTLLTQPTSQPLRTLENAAANLTLEEEVSGRQQTWVRSPGELFLPEPSPSRSEISPQPTPRSHMLGLPGADDQGGGESGELLIQSVAIRLRAGTCSRWHHALQNNKWQQTNSNNNKNSSHGPCAVA